MLTRKQMQDLPKGVYPNHELVRRFKKQQGKGNSAYFLDLGKESKKTGWYVKGRLLKDFKL